MQQNALTQGAPTATSLASKSPAVDSGPERYGGPAHVAWARGKTGHAHRWLPSGQLTKLLNMAIQMVSFPSTAGDFPYNW